MARISRSKLKGLIKECLIEILTEGSVSSHTDAPRRIHESRKKKSPPPRSTALDNIRFEKNIASTVDQITDDPMMASIFADTAATTLQEQLGAESKSGGVLVEGSMDAAAYAVNQADPMDLFDGVAENWATLAFDGKKST